MNTLQRNVDVSVAEKSACSVFVGNIPYDATEEQLKDIFEEVGPVVNFRLVYDRETGKPKGYGFCEFKDQETAMSAMRNLNSFEIGGRALRVDHAASERNKEELKALYAQFGGPPQEPMYGEEVDNEKAPEAISKAVASLPPEQMFQLMKQMRTCIQNNPNEARNLLLQNPQLAYALLQAQVIMKIVDPQVALSILHRQNPILSNMQEAAPAAVPTQTAMQPPPMQQPPPPMQPPMMAQSMQPAMPPMPMGSFGGPPPSSISDQFRGRGGDRGDRYDPRDRDMRGGGGGGGHERGGGGGHERGDRDLRMTVPPPPMPMDQDLRAPPGGYRGSFDPRRGATSQYGSDGGSGFSGGPPVVPPSGPPGGQGPPMLPPQNINNNPLGNPDQEKAKLIMQVLSLTDQQIATLPPDQRESIMVLKQQISNQR